VTPSQAEKNRQTLRIQFNGFDLVIPEEGKVGNRETPNREIHQTRKALLCGCLHSRAGKVGEALRITADVHLKPVHVHVAQPPPDDRSISEVWTALGGELKPSLDLACVMPVDVFGLRAVGPPVLEPVRLRLGDEETQRRAARAAAASAAGLVVTEEVVGGAAEQLGRRLTFRTIAGDVDD